MDFIHDDFLLHSKAARTLYHDYAEQEAILDYHSHLPVPEIAANRKFQNLFEIWLQGDHYKWRAMRANGVAEPFCTGDADPYEKFLAWAKTVPHTLRNPLYHWTHLELLRYFDISELLDEGSAPQVWAEANRRLKSDDLTAQGILSNFRVRAVCTSDDPVDPLEYHQRIAASGFSTRVLPTFRPDRAMETANPAAFATWLNKLSQSCD